jgi:hypothetical protein
VAPCGGRGRGVGGWWWRIGAGGGGVVEGRARRGWPGCDRRQGGGRSGGWCSMVVQGAGRGGEVGRLVELQAVGGRRWPGAPEALAGWPVGPRLARLCDGG